VFATGGGAWLTLHGATLPDVEATSAHDVLCNARATRGAGRFCEWGQLLSARVCGSDRRAQEPFWSANERAVTAMHS